MKNKRQSNMIRKWTSRILRSTMNIVLICILFFLISVSADVYGENTKYIILLISDGRGAKHIEATNVYTGTIPLYQSDPNWTRYWMSTFPYGGSYDTTQAWSDFNYVLTGPTDSAAAATALFTGFKTANGRISVSSDASTTFLSIGEMAKKVGMAVGAISTVPVSHATPGAWVAHNADRGNTFAIADEGFFGDPNTTGTIASDLKYGGGYGPTIPSADVLIGAGGSGYVSGQIFTKLRNENGQPGRHVLVERQPGVDGGDALMAKAKDPVTKKLAGLFDQVYHYANDSGYISENPTLSESAQSAIKVLGRNTNGFVLMIEGGAIDWAAHDNNMNQMIGESNDFNNAVQTVINWVNDPANDSNWNNTLVIVTSDHETGYLTQASGVFPNHSLGNVNDTTLAKEKIVSGTGGRRASWEDTNGDNIIDAGETVYWQWNSGDHSNSLIPLYARGAGSELLSGYATKGPDTELGYYLDNTDVFLVMDSVISSEACTETGSISVTTGQTLQGSTIDLTSIVQTNNAANVNYKVTETRGCPAQSDASIISRQSVWRYDIENTGSVWMDTGYDDSGWSTGSGIFGTEENLAVTTPVSSQSTSMFFRKTFTVCNPSEVTALTLNSLFDDGMVIYINGTQVYSQGVTGNPPLYNGGVSSLHEAEIYEAKDLTSVIGLAALRGLLTAGSGNVLAVGIYNNLPSSSDIVWDGELVIDQNANDFTLFSGNSTQAQSVDTTGWTDGEKTLEVSGDDAVCLTPLPAAHGAFRYNAAGITVTPTSGLMTTEAGGTATFTVKLKTQPAANVTMSLRSSDTTEGTVLPSSLTFTSVNWNTAQTATVTGVNDNVVDGNIAYTIVTAAAVSADSNYNGRNPSNVSVTNNDNDIAGITVTPTSGLVTTEAGGKARFNVVLNTRPKAGVTIALSSSDTTEGKVWPASLRFNAWNWNLAQKVTVMGVNDSFRDGSQPYAVVTHPAVSADSDYNSLNAADVSVTNSDND